MPKLSTHCAISKKRTNYDFKELHTWIDAPQKEEGIDHRIKRHSFNRKEAEQIKKYWDEKKGKGWGQKAVIEWLFHIALDNLDTAFKWSNKSYSYGERAYNFMEFGMSKNGYIHCNFETRNERTLQSSFESDYEEEGILTSIFRSIFG